MRGKSMRAVDTNVLVRLIAGDDAKQAAQAEAFVANGAWVSLLVLAETVWVLQSVYERDARSIARTVDMLLKHRHLTLQDAMVVVAALEHFRKRPALGLADCLVVEMARKAGHLPVGTFDRDLARLDGVARVA